MPEIYCSACTMNIHALCQNTEPIDDDKLSEATNFVRCCCWSATSGSNDDKTVAESFSDFLDSPLMAGRPKKSGEAMSDVLSTGRHRAAKSKPITDGVICEWAGLKYAGGGIEPIIGCSGTILYKARGKYARHHGPDKSVLNNSPENLHLICPTCHNRWHTLNDPYYGDGSGDSRPAAGVSWLPDGECKQHNSIERASSLEIVNNEIAWAGRAITATPLEMETEDGQVD